MAGTNNYGHSAEQVGEGILEIVSAIQIKQPATQIVVMVCRKFSVPIAPDKAIFFLSL